MPKLTSPNFVLPPYGIVAETTGMSREEWDNKKKLIADLLAYDPSDRGQFGVLLRRAMDVIPGQADLASIVGASVPSLHRWAADPKKADAALSPIQRSALSSVLSVVLLHGVDAVRLTLPTVLRQIKADITHAFVSQIADGAAGAKAAHAAKVIRKATPRPTPLSSVRTSSDRLRPRRAAAAATKPPRKIHRAHKR